MKREDILDKLDKYEGNIIPGRLGFTVSLAEDSLYLTYHEIKSISVKDDEEIVFSIFCDDQQYVIKRDTIFVDFEGQKVDQKTLYRFNDEKKRIIALLSYYFDLTMFSQKFFDDVCLFQENIEKLIQWRDTEIIFKYGCFALFHDQLNLERVLLIVDAFVGERSFIEKFISTYENDNEHREQYEKALYRLFEYQMSIKRH